MCIYSSRFFPKFHLIFPIFLNLFQIFQYKLYDIFGFLVNNFNHHRIKYGLDICTNVLHILYCLILLLLLTIIISVSINVVWIISVIGVILGMTIIVIIIWMLSRILVLVWMLVIITVAAVCVTDCSCSWD